MPNVAFIRAVFCFRQTWFVRIGANEDFDRELDFAPPPPSLRNSAMQGRVGINKSNLPL